MRKWVTLALSALLVMIPLSLVAAVVQDDTVTTITENVWQLLLSTGVIGVLANVITQGAKKMGDWTAKQSPQIIRIITFAVAEVFAFIQNLTGFGMPEGLPGVDVALVEGAAGAVVAWGLYHLLKALGVQKSVGTGTG